jgi:hypothetical protein
MQTACTRQRVCQSVNGARHPPGCQPTNQPASQLARRVCSRRCSGAAFAPTFMSEREHSIMLICEAAVFSANQYGTQLECYSFTQPRERRLFYFACLHQKKGSGLETTTACLCACNTLDSLICNGFMVCGAEQRPTRRLIFFLLLNCLFRSSAHERIK